MLQICKQLFEAWNKNIVYIHWKSNEHLEAGLNGLTDLDILIKRTGIDHEQEVETVPFGCWPKTVFAKYGRYDVCLVRNQDIELNKRILRGRGKI